MVNREALLVRYMERSPKDLTDAMAEARARMVNGEIAYSEREAIGREFRYLRSVLYEEPNRFQDAEDNGFFVMGRIFHELGEVIDGGICDEDLEVIKRILVYLSLEIGGWCSFYTTMGDMLTNYKVEEMCFDIQEEALTYEMLYKFYS